MMNELIALQNIKGLRWTIQRTDYSWQDKNEYAVLFRFDKDGDEISVTRTGSSLELVFHEALEAFQQRLRAGFKPFEIYPTAIESKVVNDD
jgi:hypothetical protein